MAQESQIPLARIQREDTRSYRVQGAMTFATVTSLWHQGDGMISDENHLQIDLAGVTHTDSGGLALLVEWLREASRRGARIEFLNLPEQMRALASAANLSEILGLERETAPT